MTIEPSTLTANDFNEEFIELNIRHTGLVTTPRPTLVYDVKIPIEASGAGIQVAASGWNVQIENFDGSTAATGTGTMTSTFTVTGEDSQTGQEVTLTTTLTITGTSGEGYDPFE